MNTHAHTTNHNIKIIVNDEYKRNKKNRKNGIRTDKMRIQFVIQRYLPNMSFLKINKEKCR